MPKKRGNVWYTKRTYPPLGKIEKSLRTGSKQRAEYIEGILLQLASRGHTEVLRAFSDGLVSPQEVVEAWDSQQMHGLAQRLRRKSATLEDAINDALEWKKPDVAGSTYERYVTGLDHFKKHAGARTDVSDALAMEITQSFKGKRLEAVSSNTVNNDLGAVSILASYALLRGWISERPRIKRSPHKVRVKWLEAQVKAYFGALRPGYRTQQLLLISTGLRLGESEALRKLDVREDGGGMRLGVTGSKTEDGVRTVYVPPWAAKALHEHIRQGDLSETDRLFTLKRRGVQTEHDRACAESGIHEYTIHDHRHTAAVALARAGMPLHLLQKQLGHKHIEMTMKYAEFHPSYNDVAPHFEQMGALLGLGVGAPATAPP